MAKKQKISKFSFRQFARIRNTNRTLWMGMGVAVVGSVIIMGKGLLGGPDIGNVLFGGTLTILASGLGAISFHDWKNYIKRAIYHTHISHGALGELPWHCDVCQSDGIMGICIYGTLERPISTVLCSHCVILDTELAPQCAIDVNSL